MNKMIFPLGVTITAEGSKIVYIDLESQPHILVGGITGSGKTSCIKCLLTAMCLQDVELKIIDMKMGGDYNVFRNYKYLTAFIKNIEDAEIEINKIRTLMIDRFQELDRTNCKDFKDYNKRFKNTMKPIVVLIEEYTMLSDDKKFNKELNIILAQARAVNIKIILSIQRPCHENLNTKLKANLNHTIAFKVRNTYNSEILLDKGDYRAVNNLHGKGEAILTNDNQDVEFKSYFLEDREIKKMIFMKCYMGNMIPQQNIKRIEHTKLKEVSLI
jgi:S-DNA-T family DNA segregation ATPase FtsK/SpoIIIE